MAKRNKKSESPVAVVETPLLFESPESSSISSASYDPVTCTMTVHFKHGKGYDHSPFPLELWREFAMAASKGRFFAERIRPMYAGKVRV